MLHQFVFMLFAAVLVDVAVAQQVASGRTAVVSLMVPAEDKVQQKYTNCLKVFIKSLRSVGYTGEIVILATADTPYLQRQQVSTRNATVNIVTKISAKRAKNRSLLNMLTKLQVWAMVDYEQVIFFDSDFVFLCNPVTAFEECGTHPFCACADTGISSFTQGRLSGHSYFNSGFMVIRPSIKTYHYLTSKSSVAAAEGTQFVDQDMLNSIFQNKWKRLDSKYNLMHVSGPISETTVAIHEKLWIMQEKYPSGNWIWNKLTSRVEPGFENGMAALRRRKIPLKIKQIKMH